MAGAQKVAKGMILPLSINTMESPHITPHKAIRLL